MLRRVLLPHLYPVFHATASIARLQPIKAFNLTLVTNANETSLMVYVFSQVRSGFTPKINALAFILIVLALALVNEMNRRRRAPIKAEARRADEAMQLSRPACRWTSSVLADRGNEEPH